MRRILTLTVLAATLTAPISAHATGLHRCEAPDRAQWLTKAELTAKLENEGWSVRRMKEDGGCWEVYGSTPDGQGVEGYFYPTTGAAELITQRGRTLFRAE